MSQVRLTAEGLRKAQGLGEGGMRRASEALTGLLGRPIRLDVASVRVLAPGTLPELMTETTADGMAGLRCQISGEVRGEILLLVPRAAVWRMLEALLGAAATPRSLSRQEESALQEVANILASSFLSELGERSGRRMMHSPPRLQFGKIAELLESMRRNFSDRGMEVLAVQACFEDPERAIEGRLLVLPELASLRAVLEGPDAAGATA